MIKVTDIASKIAEKCFTEQEKTILEFSSGQIKISIDKQLSSFFRHSYYRYDEESLYADFLLIKEQQIAVLKKIENEISTINLATNPISFFRRKNKQMKTNSGSISISSSKSDSTNNESSFSESVNNQWEDGKTLTKNRDAKSETNVVLSTDDVWEKWAIGANNRNKKTISKGEKEGQYSIQSENIASEAHDPDPSSKQVSSQYFNENQSLQNNITDSYINTTIGGGTSDNQDSKTGSANLRNLSKDIQHAESRFIIGEAVLKTAWLNLPKFRNEYWSAFHEIFISRCD